MALSELMASLRTDLGDSDGTLFEEATLVRCLLKSAYLLARDLAIEYVVQDGEIVPEPADEERELLLLLARIAACQVMRAVTANAFSFASGDKRVDKTKQASHWADLETALRAQYRARLAEVNPNAVLGDDDYFVNPGAVSPLLYEQGSARRCQS